MSRFATGVTIVTADGPCEARAASRLLDGTLAALECAVHEADGGDHRIVIGRVLSARLADEPLAPLLFAESRYHGIGAELVG